MNEPTTICTWCGEEIADRECVVAFSCKVAHLFHSPCWKAQCEWTDALASDGGMGEGAVVTAAKARG